MTIWSFACQKMSSLKYFPSRHLQGHYISQSGVCRLVARQRHDIRPPRLDADGPTDAATASEHGLHGILEITDAQISSGPGARGVVRREQYGNNLGRKTAQMIPNHPRSTLR